MPLYCYSTPTDEVVELFYPMGKAPEHVVLENNAIAVRDFGAEHAPRQAGGGWPIKCVASAVKPNQAQALRDLFKREGLSVQVTNDGRPIYENAQHRKRALKVRGFHDNDSY